MELEKAIERCNDFINENKSRPIILHTAIETVIKELKNRIPKKKIEEIYNNDEPMTITERVEFYQRKLKELLEDKNE